MTLTFIAFFQTLVAQQSLREDFIHPKDEHRAWIIWQWMDGLVNREAITHDLEAFKAAGLSGVQNFQSDWGCRLAHTTARVGLRAHTSMSRPSTPCRR